MSKFKALLLDIEGTICPISFVKDTLFPYAKTAISSKISTLGSSFPLTHKPLTSSSSSSSTKDSENPLLDHLSAFPQEYLSSPQSLLTHILSLIDNDIKDPALKSLQGYLWKDGYVSGIIKAPLYKDAIETIIRASKELQKGVSIYSSGSVAAQKLLLKYTTTIEDTTTTSSTTITDSQDLTLLINQYFDTVNAGPKIDPASYDLIASSLGLASSSDDKKSILFLSDNPKEVEAAIKAGLTSYIVIRPGNAPLDDETLKTYKAINTFENLL